MVADRATELRSWLALLRVQGLGPIRGRELLTRFGDPAAVLAAGPDAWRAAGVTERTMSSLRAPDWRGVDADQRWLEGNAHDLVTLDDERYPPRLRELADAPLALFTSGDADLLSAPQLAVIGSRSATAQGRANTRRFTTVLVNGGFTITSGLALGIDATSHQAALDAGGATIAVCGSGLDRVYPARHRELAHQIATRGLLVSEFSLGTPPRAEHFPRRNRVISGLAIGVLVVEAARLSGSLITARLAAEQGREVFAIPGSIHNPLAAGCHALIRDGARLVESPWDIFEELRLPPPPEAPAGRGGATVPEDPLQARILELLGHDPVSLDLLIARAEVPPAALHEALLALELAGRVSAGPGDLYSRLDRE